MLSIDFQELSKSIVDGKMRGQSGMVAELGYSWVQRLSWKCS